MCKTIIYYHNNYFIISRWWELFDIITHQCECIEYLFSSLAHTHWLSARVGGQNALFLFALALHTSASARRPKIEALSFTLETRVSLKCLLKRLVLMFALQSELRFPQTLPCTKYKRTKRWYSCRKNAQLRLDCMFTELILDKLEQVTEFSISN